ncbi:MAG: glycosyltransferase family 4 protein [Gemmatimonadota bacterium]
MRICVIAQDPELGGGEYRKLQAFLRYAARRGHCCDVYHPAEGSSRRASGKLRREPGLGQIHAIPISGTSPHHWRAASFGRRCRISGSYDAHQLISGSMDLALPLVRRGLPFVAWVAGTYSAETGARPRTRLRHYYLYNRVFDRRTLRQEIACARAASRVLAVSRYSEANIVRDLALPPTKVDVVRPPVDTERFTPAASASRSRPYLLSVARLDRGKGFPVLLEAFRRVAAEADGLELRIAGAGPVREMLERMARSFGLERRVRFLGHVEGAALIRLYQGAELFTLASRQEALGIVYLEAMACGLPVVATDAGGTGEVVREGETGFLVPRDDPASLADRLLAVLSDSGLRSRLGVRGRRAAVASFGYEAAFHAFDATYDEIFGTARPV